LYIGCSRESCIVGNCIVDKSRNEFWELTPRGENGRTALRRDGVVEWEDEFV